MRIELKWSASRQMWVGQMVSARQPAISWLAQCKRWLWLAPQRSSTRKPTTSRIWLSQRSLSACD